MNPLLPTRSRLKGSVLIFALLIVMAVAFVLAGWATMMATRSLYPDTTLTAMQRRISMANGRALARQYLLNSLTNGTNPVTNATLAGGWGGFSVAASAISILSNATPPSAYNPFSPGERYGFEQVISGNVTSSDRTNSWSFRLRSRSPIFAGYPLVVQLTTDTVSSYFSTTNTALLWSNAAAYTCSLSTYQASNRLSLLPNSGTNISAFPYTPLAMEYPSNQISFSGRIQATPISGVTPATNGITTTNGANQTITMDLGVVNATGITSTNSVLLLYQIDATSGNLSRNLVLVGGNATAASLPPLHIVYQTGANDLTRVTLSGSNQRRVYLSIIKSTPVTFSTSAATSWRLGILLQGCVSTWSLGGSLTLTGGIRSSGGSLNVSSGNTISLQKETDPGGLDSIADRIVWIEENKTE